jgi:A/G-specific adenine glycosylase
VACSSTASFADRLLAWWDRYGRRDLPWQHTRTPYRVWISEIMLQQTQVATVIPYYERWMEVFPDIESLARAPLDQVLSLWPGLGYYARARNLHRAAIQCAEQNHGRLPKSSEALCTLPGIGASTANAIISQSTDRPAAVLDGNVRRVLARHAAIEGWTGKSAVQKRLWQIAEARLPGKRGADYTQAIMDLGAMLCTRTSPACSSCPVQADCQAFACDRVGQLPTPKPATKISDKVVCMFLIRDDRGRILLEKRPPAGIWGALWCLPEGDSLESLESRLGISAGEASALPPFEHRLSHVRMTIHPVLATAANARQVKCTELHDWFRHDQLTDLGLPKPAADLLTRLNNGELE